MDTVKKDVEDLKLDLHTIKGSIDETVKLIKTLKGINKAKLDILKERMVEHTIAFNLLMHLFFKDADKVQVFEDKVQELKEEIYARMAKEKGEDLQFMSGKH